MQYVRYIIYVDSLTLWGMFKNLKCIILYRPSCCQVWSHLLGKAVDSWTKTMCSGELAIDAARGWSQPFFKQFKSNMLLTYAKLIRQICQNKFQTNIGEEFIVWKHVDMMCSYENETTFGPTLLFQMHFQNMYESCCTCVALTVQELQGARNPCCNPSINLAGFVPKESMITSTWVILNMGCIVVYIYIHMESMGFNFTSFQPFHRTYSLIFWDILRHPHIRQLTNIDK